MEATVETVRELLYRMMFRPGPRAQLFRDSWVRALDRREFHTFRRKWERRGYPPGATDMLAFLDYRTFLEQQAARRRAQQGQQVGGAASRRDR